MNILNILENDFSEEKITDFGNFALITGVSYQFQSVVVKFTEHSKQISNKIGIENGYPLGLRNILKFTIESINDIKKPTEIFGTDFDELGGTEFIFIMIRNKYTGKMLELEFGQRFDADDDGIRKNRYLSLLTPPQSLYDFFELTSIDINEAERKSLADTIHRDLSKLGERILQNNRLKWQFGLLNRYYWLENSYYPM